MNFIVETKNEYTIQLVNILTPLLYEGFESIYIETRKILKKGEEKILLKTFQQFIKKIPLWNNNLIQTETQRIISQSRCDWLPDLLKAVIKSNIILLSNSNPTINGNFLINHEYLNIPLQQFIHKCYIECARQIYSSPYLFFHNVKPIDRKRNQRECLNIIKESIKEGIRKMLPVQHILREYLGNEYKSSNDDLEKPISLNDSDNLKKLISKDLKDFINPDVIQNYNLTNDITYDDCSNEDFDDEETTNLLLEIKNKYSKGHLLENKSFATGLSGVSQPLATDQSGGSQPFATGMSGQAQPLATGLSGQAQPLDNIKNNIGESKNQTSSQSYNDLHNMNISEFDKRSNSTNHISATNSTNHNSATNSASHKSVSYNSASHKNATNSASHKNATNSASHKNATNSASYKSATNSESHNSATKKGSDDKKNTNISPLKGNNNSISYKIEHDSEYEDVFSNINNGNKEKKKRKDIYFSKYNKI